MALDKQITSVRIKGDNFANGNISATTYEINVQNFNVQIEPQYWNDKEYDQAISGFRRNNFRGFRANYSFTFEQSTEPSTIRSLFNDFYTELVTNAGDHVEVSLDGGSNYEDVVPENLEYLITYSNTIGSFIPSISLVGQDILTSIPSNLQAP